MTAPRLNRRLTLEAAQRLDDGAGGYRETWVAFGEHWAEVTARTRVQADGAFTRARAQATGATAKAFASAAEGAAAAETWLKQARDDSAARAEELATRADAKGAREDLDVPAVASVEPVVDLEDGTPVPDPQDPQESQDPQHPLDQGELPASGPDEGRR